mmetsp:Transcript_32947/g.72373  ORF Transcript_32947/g.72373 Transcript_32947/m.72373 type:complete len:200 (+) Transcript_32947:598-1197(+)
MHVHAYDCTSIIFFGWRLSFLRPCLSSSNSILPSLFMSSSFHSASSASSSTSSSFITGTTGFSVLTSMTSPESSAATASMNCSVVRPLAPHRSRVPLPLTISACIDARIFAVKAETSGPAFARSAEWFMAPMRASTMPRGLSDVSSPRRCACHMSATVPCDASYSLIMRPSAAFPMRLEVMKPGERCTCATSSVSMSPS